jgi:hypothetical protein
MTPGVWSKFYSWTVTPMRWMDRYRSPWARLYAGLNVYARPTEQYNFIVRPYLDFGAGPAPIFVQGH